MMASLTKQPSKKNTSHDYNTAKYENRTLRICSIETGDTKKITCSHKHHKPETEGWNQKPFQSPYFSRIEITSCCQLPSSSLLQLLWRDTLEIGIHLRKPFSAVTCFQAELQDW